MRGFFVERGVEIPMRDGTILRADVWYAGENPRPVVLFRTPYDKTSMNIEPLGPEDCVRHGFTAVVQDTRGRFTSDGHWQPMMWDLEGDDTFDTIEWTAGQAWCDGNVCMSGPSYLGIVQWLGAMRKPPHLRAIAPAMATSAELDVAATGGALRLSHIVGWLGFMIADWVQKAVAQGQQVDTAAITEFMVDPHEHLYTLPLTRILDVPDCPVTMRQVLSGVIEHTPQIRAAEVAVPTLSVTGWYDVFSGPTIALFKEMHDREPSAHRLIVGPWGHSATLNQSQGEINFGFAANGVYSRTPDHTLDFFSRHLTSTGPSEEASPVRYFMMMAGDWRTAESWPPPEAEPTHWFLRQNGVLDRTKAQGIEAPDTYTYDPNAPTPSRGGRLLPLGGHVPGPLDQRCIEERSDTRTFTTEVLDVPLEVAGQITMSLFAASTAVDTDFIVKISDIFPDGRSLVVCDGALRARYRNGFDDGRPLNPGVVEQYQIDLGHTAWRFAAGHQIRLLVASANFPHLDRNLNTGAPLGEGTEAQVAEQSIHHDAVRPSCIELPVLRSPHSQSECR